MNCLDSQSLTLWSQQQAQELDLFRFTVSLTGEGDIHLDHLHVPRYKQGQGVGTKAMQRLCAVADYWHTRILLTPSDRNISTGTTSRLRLIAFYQRFGFHLNRGIYRDTDVKSQMIREPKTINKTGRELFNGQKF